MIDDIEWLTVIDLLTIVRRKCADGDEALRVITMLIGATIGATSADVNHVPTAIGMIDRERAKEACEKFLAEMAIVRSLEPQN